MLSLTGLRNRLVQQGVLRRSCAPVEFLRQFSSAKAEVDDAVVSPAYKKQVPFRTDHNLVRLPSVITPPVPANIEEKGGMRNLWDRYLSVERKRERAIRAEGFFQAAVQQASKGDWYGPGRIPRNFRSRHALLTMHIWFLNKRLISDTYNKEEALAVQENLFSIFWEDTSHRIRQLKINEWTLNKHLMEVQQYTFLHLTHYDHIYSEMLHKPQERLEELRHLIWFHILVRDPDAEERYDHLDRIAHYIDANFRNIVLEWPDKYYRDSRVLWVNLPDFDNMKDRNGELLPNNPVHPDDDIPEPWMKAITIKGEDYYWNPSTLESTWEKPQAI